MEKVVNLISLSQINNIKLKIRSGMKSCQIIVIVLLNYEYSLY